MTYLGADGNRGELITYFRVKEPVQYVKLSETALKVKNRKGDKDAVIKAFITPSGARKGAVYTWDIVSGEENAVIRGEGSKAYISLKDGAAVGSTVCVRVSVEARDSKTYEGRSEALCFVTVGK